MGAGGVRRRPTASERRSARARRRNTGSELGARVAAAIPALIFAIAIVGFGDWVFVAGVALLGCVCVHELCAMFDFTNPSRLAGFVGIIGLLVAAHVGGPQTLLLALVACVPLVFAAAVAQARPAGMPGVSVTLLGLTWVGVALAHAVMLRDLPHGDGIVINVLVGTFVGDSAAYIGGRMFGRRPLAPTISPKKTVEGLAFGIIGAIVGVWFAGLYQDWLSGMEALLLGVGVAIAAPVGDLFESYIKRSAKTKDSGRLFGAHGGALDRLDALLFTGVVGYYIWKAIL